MKKLLFLLLFCCSTYVLFAQEAPIIGISDNRPEVYAFVNATITVDSKTVIENGTLVIKKGIIKDIGKNIKIPNNAIVYDLKGKFIYPSFIDMYTNYGMPELKKSKGSSFKPSQFYSSEKNASNWNDAINSDYQAVDEFKINKKLNNELRKLGFGTVLSFKPDGIARGTSVLVSLINENENKAVIKSEVAAHYSFDKGSSEQNYPASLFGAIALLRQTYLNSDWYNSLEEKEFTDVSLERWDQIQAYPQIFDVNDKLSALRADKIGDEFGVQYIIKGNGDEYQMINEIKKTNASYIMPLEFPEKQKIHNAYEADMVSLKSLKHWEMAPYVYSILESNNIQFALTSYGLKDKKAFNKNLRKAIQLGLSEETALKSLTEIPAKLLGVDDILGSLSKGKQANFIVTSGNIFSEETILYENWIRGDKHVINDINKVDYKGKYKLKVNDLDFALEITGDINKPEFKIVKNDSVEIKANGKIVEHVIYLNFKAQEDDKNEIRLSGWVEDKTFKGSGFFTSGEPVKWEANYLSEQEKKEQKKSADSAKNKEIGKMIYPFVAHGNIKKPTQKAYLIKNATVWTNESVGIIENMDVVVKNGKIIKLGKDLTYKGAIEIDGTGKHLTSGVIDEHSHIAGSGNINEPTHAVTSEVRMKDIIDPEDINIYRQLSGGVTAAQILHGSANPIGGQSALIKHRWGVTPDELLINDGAQFLKLALGENVKQSRKPGFLQNRFPISRMGVEAIIKDAFKQAQDYQSEWDKYNSLSAKERKNVTKPRKDLRMEALVDVLEEESYISCHAYVQSETNMIMKLAEEFGIKAHTLIHNSEGYKIADKILEHGAYASNLPDWWAYKYEVYQAIPYNSAIQHQQGVVVAIHSDNAELARRLNQEAAKAVKYGGVSQEEAWKMVTLNPAKILHLDHRMGSIKVGKDADLVLWSDNPLSMYAVAEKTMVDGIIYYDREADAKMQEWIQKERNRLINKMNQEK